MIRSLLAIARPSAGWLVASLVARIGGLVAGIGLLALPAWAVMTAAAGGRVSIIATAVALVLLAVAKGTLRYLEHFWGHHAAFDLLARMRLDLFDAVAPLSPDDERSGSGDLATAATRDVDRVEVFFAHTIVPAVSAMLVPAAVVIAIAFAVGPAGAAVALAGFVVGGIVVPLVGRRASERASRDTVAARAAIAQHVAEDAAGHVEILTLGAQSARLATLAERDAALGVAARRGSRRQAGVAALGSFWPLAAAVIMVAAAPEGELAANVVAAAAVVGAAPAIQVVEGLTRSLPAALASARRYLALLATRPSIADPAAPTRIPEGPLGVRFDGVAVGYVGEPVVRGVDAHVAPGGRLAIVGASGSGKSTLASLVIRDRDPLEGAVLLTSASGDIEVRDVRLADLRRAVGVVSQRPVLVRGTVLDNLRLGSPGLTEDRAWAALEAAQLAGDVRAHPDGIHAALSEDALSLSGGQRQRLSLARALAREPRILVLDEATSHQDPATQEAVRRALAARADLTVIVIAHRAEVTLGIDDVLRMA